MIQRMNRGRGSTRAGFPNLGLRESSAELAVRGTCPALPIHPSDSVGGKRELCITFDELSVHKTWWLLADGETVDLCTEDPGKDVDLYLNSSVRTIVEVWEGDLDVRTALRNKRITAHGMRHLIRTMPDWFGVCIYQDVGRGDPKLMRREAD